MALYNYIYAGSGKCLLRFSFRLLFFSFLRGKQFYDIGKKELDWPTDNSDSALVVKRKKGPNGDPINAEQEIYTQRTSTGKSKQRTTTTTTTTDSTFFISSNSSRRSCGKKTMEFFHLKSIEEICWLGVPEVAAPRVNFSICPLGSLFPLSL